MEVGFCPRCGGRLATGTLDGLCTRCLVAAVQAEDAPVAQRDDDSHGAPATVQAAVLPSDEPTQLAESGHGNGRIASGYEGGPHGVGLGSGPATWSDRLVLPKIDGYDVVRQLTQGGQGVVYQAIQRSTKRMVAVKVLLDGARATPSARMRFEREVELVAGLKHPNVISVFDSGVTADGHPFYVMDYVRGLPITQYVREQKLNVRACLELFATACDAVSHAHQKGVIHRDLKPNNILVDAEGSVRVLDFGLAKALAAPVAAPVSLTGVVVGTLHYMSPEQTRGNPDALDTRTDVYSLGVILYEMLTGQYPYLLGGDIAGVIRQISEVTPAPLSKRWTKENGVLATPSRVQRSTQCPIESDVETIVQKALSKERDRRYDSAGELARDVRRFLRDEPILARRASAWYQISRFARRNKALVAGVVGIAAAVLVGSALTAWQAVRANEQKGRAEQLAARARDLEALAKKRLVTGLLLWGDSLSRAGDPVSARHSYMLAWDQASWVGPLATPILAGVVEVTAGEPPLCGFYGREGGVAGFVGHSQEVRGVAMCPDGVSAITGSRDGTLIRWDLATGLPLCHYRGHGSGAHGPSLSPDGRRVLAGYDDGTMSLFDVATGTELTRLTGHSRASPGDAVGVWCVAFSPDGATALSASDDHTLKLWDLNSSDCLKVLSGHSDSVASVVFLPDGRRALSGSHDGTLKLWDLTTGHVLRTYEGHEGPVNSVALLPAGGKAVSASFDGTLRQWDLAGGAAEFVLKGHKSRVWRVAVASDGRTAVSGSDDQTVRVWDLAKRCEVAKLAGHVGDGMGVAISADGSTAVASGAGARLRVWGVRPAGDARDPWNIGHSVTCVDISDPQKSDRLALLGTADGAVLFWDAATQQALRTLSGHGSPVRAVRLLKENTETVSVGADGLVIRHDLASGRVVGSCRREAGAIRSVALSLDGRYGLSMSEGKTESVELWNAATGRTIRSMKWRAEPVTALSLAADGRTALAGFENGSVRVWDAGTDAAEETRSFAAHSGRVTGAAFSSGGEFFATAGDDGYVKLWAIDPEMRPRVFGGHGGPVTAVGLSPDGMCAMSGGVAGGGATALRAWDFGRVAAHRGFERDLPQVFLTARQQGARGKALAVIGEWYAFRGRDDWAVSYLETAREEGAEVSSLTLAQAYLRLAERVDLRAAGRHPETDASDAGATSLASRHRASATDYSDAARRAFQEAQSRGECSKLYADLCLQALSGDRGAPR
jgi:WD40 repeat protein/serine/threonine protein kinase